MVDLGQLRPVGKADLLERYRCRGVVAAAAEDGVSVSAWLTEAARRALKVRDGLAAVAEWEAEHGAFTAAELAAARHRVAGGLADSA